MDAFARIVKALGTLRQGKTGLYCSIKRVERRPNPNEQEWCLENIALDTLASLPPLEHLTHLYLVNCGKLKALSGIERFPGLKSLWIYESDRLASIDGIQSLGALKYLTIWPSFSSQITLETLDPLRNIKTLREFIFAGRARDGSLTALQKLPQLETLFLSNAFSWEEFAKFEANQPAVQFCWKGGVVYDVNPSVMKCPSCGSAQAILTGKGLRLCCPKCDIERLNKHLARYRSLASK